MLQEILNNLITVLLTSGVIVYLSKALMSNLFSKDLEKFKANIEKEAFSYRVRYEKMHSERAEVTKELYKKIVKTYRTFHSYMCPLQTSGEPSQDEKGGEAVKIANNFTDYYEENRIFVDEELAKKIDKLSETFKQAWNEFEIYRLSKKNREFDLENWREAWKIISEQTPIIKKEIEDEFRKIIGIEDEH